MKTYSEDTASPHNDDNEQPVRLVVVSNRLPVRLQEQDGEWSVQPGAGGLVTALAPVLKNRGGLWIGWSGTHDSSEEMTRLLTDFSKDAGYGLHPVSLTQKEVDDYYYGFSNEVAWPLFHDFQSRCVFKPEYWSVYLDVNLKFAEVVAQHSRPSDYIWVHDYHLMHLAFIMRNMGLKRKLGFFLHIPFPPPDIFFKLPWRDKLLRSLLEYDLLGFQTARDAENFLECMRRLVPGTQVEGDGQVVDVHFKGRTMRVGSFPISIDFNQFANMAQSREVQGKVDEFRQALRHRTVLLGVDRLDYTKGIPQRLEAFRHLLTRFPEMQEKISLMQVAVPSREGIPEYQDLKVEIEQLVGEINGQFTTPGWVPVHYLYRSLPREELVAYYRAADMALITPLRDGMNLVAKEYCACNINEDGLLFLSEFAGAAAQLQKHGAVLVNPYDLEGVARAIRRGFEMDREERRERMHAMRESVRQNNIYWWVDSFLQAAFARTLDDFPAVEKVDFHTSSE